MIFCATCAKIGRKLVPSNSLNQNHRHCDGRRNVSVLMMLKTTKRHATLIILIQLISKIFHLIAWRLQKKKEEKDDKKTRLSIFKLWQQSEAKNCLAPDFLLLCFFPETLSGASIWIFLIRPFRINFPLRNSPLNEKLRVWYELKCLKGKLHLDKTKSYKYWKDLF